MSLPIKSWEAVFFPEAIKLDTHLAIEKPHLPTSGFSLNAGPKAQIAPLRLPSVKELSGFRDIGFREIGFREIGFREVSELKSEVSKVQLTSRLTFTAPMRPWDEGVRSLADPTALSFSASALPTMGVTAVATVAMAGTVGTPTWGGPVQPLRLPPMSLSNHPNLQRFLHGATRLAAWHPVGRAASWAIGGALLLSSLREFGVRPAAEFVTLPPEPKTQTRGYAVLPGAGDATVLGGHTKPIPTLPTKEEFPALDAREIQSALAVPGKAASAGVNDSMLQGRPAQRWDAGGMLLSSALPQGEDKPFKYVHASHATTSYPYTVAQGEFSGQKFILPHALAHHELVQLPDGKVLMNTAAGLRPVPEGEYYFGSVRGRTGIADSIPNSGNPAHLWHGDQMRNAFDVTRGLTPELWGVLHIADGKVTERTNHGGVILRPSNDNLYGNRYPGDSSLGATVWKLSKGERGKYELIDPSGFTVTPEGVYSFFTHENGDIYLVQSEEGWHPDVVRSKRGRFAGEVQFDELGYLDVWNDRTGHLMSSQYSAQWAGLPLVRFRPSTSTYDYNFGMSTNGWYAQAQPASAAAE